MTETLWSDSWTWAGPGPSSRGSTSSSRFWTSSSRLTRSLLRPSFSLSASSVWAVTWVSSAWSAALVAETGGEGRSWPARRTGRLRAVLPSARSWSARREAALALSSHSTDAPAGLARVVLDHAQVADRLGDRVLGLGDVVGEVTDELVEHLLGILGAVEDRVDVGPDELADAAEDRGLCHRVISFVYVQMPIRYGRGRPGRAKPSRLGVTSGRRAHDRRRHRPRRRSRRSRSRHRHRPSRRPAAESAARHCVHRRPTPWRAAPAAATARRGRARHRSIPPRMLAEDLRGLVATGRRCAGPSPGRPGSSREVGLRPAGRPLRRGPGRGGRSRGPGAASVGRPARRIAQEALRLGQAGPGGLTDTAVVGRR